LDPSTAPFELSYLKGGEKPFWKSFFAPLNLGARISLTPSVSPSAQVPKLVHQTYSSRQMPDELAANVARIKALNPNWEHRLYDDAEVDRFVRTNYGLEVWKTFAKINPKYGAARADMFRYLVLYKCGGIYLDIKSYPTLPFDDVLLAGDRYLISTWDNKDGDFEGWGLHEEVNSDAGEFQQWYIVAASGHPFLKAAIENTLTNIDRYNPALHGTGRMGVLRLTGPIAYTLAITPLLSSNAHRRVCSRKDLGLVYSVYPRVEHQSVFYPHYSVLSEPIVRIGRGRRITSAALNTLRATRNLVRTLVRG
jgi:inositol phosphorylceramide mannosyltransferase catalytic subunit